MFNHIMVGSNDIARSKVFYDATFGAMGGKAGVQDAKGRLIYAHDGGVFLVTPPIDGKPATHANGGTIGFKMASGEQAAAWHAAGVANGGHDAVGIAHRARATVPGIDKERLSGWGDKERRVAPFDVDDVNIECVPRSIERIPGLR